MNLLFFRNKPSQEANLSPITKPLKNLEKNLKKKLRKKYTNNVSVNSEIVVLNEEKCNLSLWNLAATNSKFRAQLYKGRMTLSNE